MTTRRRREDVFSSPKFFQLIVDPTAQHLRIPAEFMKRQGRDLGNRVFLKVPSTSVSWKVDLIRSNAETLLQNGWKEFAHRYSLCFGHFLMFEYHGNSEFNVVIFDTTASEINYPHFQLESEPSGTESGGVEKKGKDVEKETSMAYQRALDYTAGPTFRNPFFISVMQPSYVIGHGLEIPTSFAKENLLACKSSSVNLGIKNNEKKVWAIKLWCSSKRAKLSSGWKDFVNDNGLKVGDACLFQVSNHFHWDVVIFKS